MFQGQHRRRHLVRISTERDQIGTEERRLTHAHFKDHTEHLTTLNILTQSDPAVT